MFPKSITGKTYNMEQEQLYEYRNYLRLKGYSDSTLRHHLEVARQYLEYCDTNSPEGFIGYIRSREQLPDPKKKLSPNTLNTYYSGLKVFLSYREQVTGQREFLHIPAVRKYIPEIDILSLDEISLLFKRCRDLRDKTVLVLLYHLALRIGEAARVCIEDIDTDKGLLFVSRSKTGRQRQVPVSSTAKEVLLAYIEEERPGRESHRLLQGIKGDITKAGIEIILRKIVKRTGIQKRVYPHLLRHSIASHLLQRGMPLEQVGQFLGHACLESTRRYTHLIQERI